MMIIQRFRLFAIGFGVLAVIPFIAPKPGWTQISLPGSSPQITAAQPLLGALSVLSATPMNLETTDTVSTRSQPFSFTPIGMIRSPYTPDHRPPRQGRLAPDVTTTIEIDEDFEEGLEGIEDFNCIYVLFVFDRSQGWTAKVTPPGAPKARGVFSTRSPNRPCPIGLTVVRLDKREGRFLFVKGMDAFDQTPVLDIKPYIGSIDSFPDAGQNAVKDLGLKPQDPAK